MNQKRSIALELSNEEKALYTYSQDVSMKVLEEMREKFAAAEQTVSEIAGSEPVTSDQCDLLDDLPSLMRR